MTDEQSPNEKPVNPAADIHAPRQAVASEVAPEASQEITVTAAPPEESTATEASNDVTQETVADVSVSPAEPTGDSADPNTTQSQAVQNEIKDRETNNAPAAEEAKTPNPASKAIIGTVLMTIILASLAVFAYLMTKK